MTSEPGLRAAQTADSAEVDIRSRAAKTVSVVR